ncbi:hypothetical protein KRR55_13465 [Paeniglutamicibacter sp. ABSL32-1]|uniref:hypothetical protein n=1 Tax=Paeniglutamicibacter quisquiliarum TaxID=2849498 RepID=UPI001C2D8B3D|nr:hypothetical protein [Paeniglutamicibacter quisquiliarum]MBV1780121.1 hypothetical protein [Paeniglutamicibacter quisquiliarum]
MPRQIRKHATLKVTQASPSVPAALTGHSAVSHAGLNALEPCVGGTGVGSLRDDSISRFAPEEVIYRSWLIIGSLAVMLADGVLVSDLDVLRNNPVLFRQVPSLRWLLDPRESPEAPWPNPWAPLAVRWKSPSGQGRSGHWFRSRHSGAVVTAHRPRCVVLSIRVAQRTG